jgi:VWFA-related protein
MRHPSRTTFVIAVTALVTSDWAIAQEKPVFRASTRLVQLSVVVEDRDGPVSGLTAGDFRLYDGGQEQRIELFLTDSAMSRARSTETLPAASPEAATPPLAFSNRLAWRGAVTVVLFDRVNTQDSDQIYARQKLISFLQQIRSDDRIALYVLERDSILVLHDFSNDARSLVRAMARYRAMTSNEALETPAPEPADTGDAALDARMAEFLDRAAAEMKMHFDGIRSDATMNAFQTVANRLSGVEGRKNLIWDTAGFPIKALSDRGKNVSAEIQRAIRPLNDANVTLYAVDARGLMGALTYGPRGTVGFTTLSAIHTDLDILQITAAETGGRAFANSNDIGGAVQRAVDDSQVSYTLGYYPAHGKWDGKYREIEVQVTRPGVRVRHRRGYLAALGSARLSADAAIRSALASPLEASGLELTARVEQIPASDRVKLSIAVAPGAVTLVPDGEMWKGQLELVVAQKLADGSATKSVNDTFQLNIRNDRYDDARHGFTIGTQVTLLPGVRTLYIVVHDSVGAVTGSLVVPADKLRAPGGG